MKQKNEWHYIDVLTDGDFKKPAEEGEIPCYLAFDLYEDGTGEDVIEVIWSSFYHAFLYKSFFIDITRVGYYWRYK